jgi:HAD superfamily hydrolase (TIGR01459 family)
LLNFLDIAAAFDAFFIDQFGVLHDSHRPYPGAVDALRALKGRGARIIVLSNSGRSGEENAERMTKLGLPRALYDRLITSGDAARALLHSAQSPLPLTASTHCLTIATAGAGEFAETLGVRATANGEEADLVVISGSQGDRLSLDHYRRLLTPAARRKAPCLCANPDRLMLIGANVAFGAGRIAELYEELGGSVIWVGKPHLPIYQRAAAEIGISDPKRVLCVGDSVEHDIAGAHCFGAPAALVRTGILAEMTGTELAEEFERRGATPEFILRDLSASRPTSGHARS